MKITTSLFSGAGNTFHIIEGDQLTISTENKKMLAKSICVTNPADGLIFLKKDSHTNYFQWDFYNNAGSDAEMCGNATRCVGNYIKNNLLDLNSSWTLQTKAGLIQIKALGRESFQITMTALEQFHSVHGFYCNTGVPHLVIPIETFDNYQSLALPARALRFHHDFASAGTNVTYIQRQKNVQNLKAVSYERGVENFTRACGTGAMAAAFYNYKNFNVTETIVEMPGGTLIMDLKDLKHPLMTGPAILIGNYQYEFKI